MGKIASGRFTAEIEGPFVVFLIGMRINQLWRVWQWLPTALAMGPMLRELLGHPEKGLLNAEMFFGWRSVLLVQYWRSFDALEQFARDPHDPHLPAWRAFNRRVGSDGSTGIFHETYAVAAGQYECLYANLPLFGLAKAARRLPAAGRGETARDRLQRRPPGPPVASGATTAE